jgi:hypothetical protein
MNTTKVSTLLDAASLGTHKEQDRRRHLRTVSVQTPSWRAIAALSWPAAAASTIFGSDRNTQETGNRQAEPLVSGLRGGC